MESLLERLKWKWGLLTLALLAAMSTACTSELRQTETEPLQDGRLSQGEEPLQTGQISQGGEPEIREPETEMDLYRTVFLDDGPFWDTGTGQLLSLSRIKAAVTNDDEIMVSIPQFAVVDLDQDGETEIVLWLRINDVNDVGFEILHCINGEVYGYMLFTREFNDLKTDGTFVWSGGASNSGVGTIAFSETDYTVNEIGSPNEYDALGDTDVTWYAFTDNNMDRIFG